MIKRNLKAYYCQYQNFVNQRIESTGEHIMTTFAVFGILNYPIFYLFWRFAYPTGYESFCLRFIATLLCLILLLKSYWPTKLKKYLPQYWYLTLFYCLPFFSAYMLLKNYDSPSWLTNSMLFLMLLILLVDWISFAVLTIFGAIAGCLAYYLNVGNFSAIHDYGALISNYTFSILLGAIFSRDKQQSLNAKFKGIAATGALMAHEIRTPLGAITGSIAGIKKFLPKLITEYQMAKDAGVLVPKVSTNHINSMDELIDNIEVETKYANTIVDMLLIKTSQKNIQNQTIEKCSIRECLNNALERYPFLSVEQQQSIHVDTNEDFEFLGTPLLIVHIFFNLLKNSLYFIKATQKGEITIWIEKEKNKNILHFKDTASGIPPQVMKILFNEFVTTTHHGTGLGLAFCKKVMKNLGGDIICKTELEKYTEFILIFPPLK